MKKIATFLTVLVTIILSTAVMAQEECTLKSYYSNRDIFREYETHDEVMIDGHKFRIEILSGSLNEYLEPYRFAEYDDHAPK